MVRELGSLRSEPETRIGCKKLIHVMVAKSRCEGIRRVKRGRGSHTRHVTEEPTMDEGVSSAGLLSRTWNVS